MACCSEGRARPDASVSVFEVELGTTLMVVGVSVPLTRTFTSSQGGTTRTVNSGVTAPTNSSSVEPTAAPVTGAGGTADSANMGIGVGVGIGATLVLVICVWFLWRWRRRSREKKRQQRDSSGSGLRWNGEGVGAGGMATTEAEVSNRRIWMERKGFDGKAELDGRDRTVELPE